MKDLSKTYNPKEVEDKIYARWESSGFFNPDKLEEAHDRYWKAEAYSIAMPPPNITAELHVGHSMFLTLQDLMIRYERMRGKKTLWLPGTDHAAIATNYVVERQLWETEKKTRHDIGREEFLRRVEEFIQKTRGTIQTQIRKMGASCDWSREKYTLSPELSLAVRTVFKNMYEAGLIYQGERLINWCPRCGTTLSDDEVTYQEVSGKLYYIRYPLINGKGNLIVATARPDTMLGDTAIAVHPDDSRYKKYIGQKVMLPLLNRELTVLADKFVDPKFGTGIVKITPGHDVQDFEASQRHGLEIIKIYNLEGKVDPTEALDHGFEDYANLNSEEARKKIVAELEEQGFLEKSEDAVHSQGTCYRCGATVEPMIMKQWFVNVNQKFKINNQNFLKLLDIKTDTSLKEMAAAAVKSGAIKIVPERFKKVFLQWMENLHDWNISRQIWFGHQIPVWYCDDCHETVVALDPPTACPTGHSGNLTQDPDTLDTWFSSSLWTFSTLGWPEQTGDLATFHPTSVLETGYDILFFWVARMILMTGFAMEDIPFHTVYLNGLVRDIKGKKMSKTAGNVLDPLKIIDKFGTDALRLSLVLGMTPGNDLKISEEKIASFRNFANKLWNIARFIISRREKFSSEIPEPQSLADEWILDELDQLIEAVNKSFKTYQYGLAGELLMDFTWNKFADWYLEISKISEPENNREILPYILTQLLKLWHPFIPFVTEHIWSQFSPELLMVQEYPAEKSKTPDQKPKTGNRFLKLRELITGLRNLRAEYRQEPGKTLASYLELPQDLAWVAKQQAIIEKLGRVKLNYEKIDESKEMPYFFWEGTKVYLIIADFDPNKEKMMTEKELQETETQHQKLKAQLGKKDFLKKAPAEVVEKMKQNFAEKKLRLEKLKEKIKTLK